MTSFGPKEINICTDTLTADVFCLLLTLAPWLVTRHAGGGMGGKGPL